MLNRFPYTQKTKSCHFPWTNIILDQADINSYPLAIFSFHAFAHQSMHTICHKYIFKYTATSLMLMLLTLDHLANTCTRYTD